MVSPASCFLGRKTLPYSYYKTIPLSFRTWNFHWQLPIKIAFATWKELWICNSHWTVHNTICLNLWGRLDLCPRWTWAHPMALFVSGLSLEMWSRGYWRPSPSVHPELEVSYRTEWKPAHLKTQTCQAETDHMGYTTCLGPFTPSNIDFMSLWSCRSLTLIQVGLRWLVIEFWFM